MRTLTAAEPESQSRGSCLSMTFTLPMAPRAYATRLLSCTRRAKSRHCIGDDPLVRRALRVAVSGAFAEPDRPRRLHMQSRLGSMDPGASMPPRVDGYGDRMVEQGRLQM